jgi:hypothetical protein
LYKTYPEISKKEYDDLVEENCYFCGKENTDDHHNTITKLNDDENYTNENTVPCCGDCKYLKNKMEINTFQHQCNLIYIKHINWILNLRNRANDKSNMVDIDKIIPFKEKKMHKPRKVT